MEKKKVNDMETGVYGLGLLFRRSDAKKRLGVQDLELRLP